MDARDAVLQALGRASGGLSRAQLQVETGRQNEPAWMLRRELQALVREGLIVAEGRTRARVYRLVTASIAPPSTEWRFSSEGSSVVARVSRPLFQRTPCSYHLDFLDAYEPNVSHFLDSATLETLHALGATPDLHEPAGTYARHVLERLLVDLSWNSSRLEGNTYSLLDTERLFLEKTAPSGRPPRETQMLLNHKQAIEYLVEEAATLELEPRAIRTLHGLLSENLMPDPSDEGRLRLRAVGISESVYLPLAVPQLVEEAFIRLLELARAIDDPFEQAFFLLVHLPYLQPFADVNKRTSRLAANLPLLKRNLQPLSFVDVPREAYTLAVLGVYGERRVEALRDVFVWAYRRSAERYRAIRASLGEPDPFRLVHRDALREAVREVVRARPLAENLDAWIAAFAERAVGPTESARFAATARRELDALNEGTLVRYRLRPSEYERWKEHVSRR